MRIYSDLAPWFHLLTAPSEYVDEAAEHIRLIRLLGTNPETLLELGSGGGNNASYLKAEFTCTLSDLSPEMLALSRTINPDLEHIQGDMRSLRLGRTFDAVFIHDAIEYMLSEADLSAAIRTAFAHVQPGGVAVFVPDTRLETLAPVTDHGGHDGDDGRSMRYLEWVTDPDPTDTTYDVDFAFLLREADGTIRVVHDHHTNGVFPEASWFRLLRDAGFVDAKLERITTTDELVEDWAGFVARRPVGG